MAEKNYTIHGENIVIGSESHSSHKKSLLDKIEKKDLLYTFFIIYLFSILVAVIVWKFSDAKLLVDQISFGSSIASIILAVVAMIYAFFQTQESSSQNAVVQEALHKISSKVDELNEIKDQITSFRVIQETMKEQIQSISNSLGDLSEVNDMPEPAKRKIEEIEDKLRDLTVNPVVIGGESIDDDLLESFIKNVINNQYKIGDEIRVTEIREKIMLKYMDKKKVRISLKQIHQILSVYARVGLLERIPIVGEPTFKKIRDI